jgi:putative hydrolase of the HAD superfamily
MLKAVLFDFDGVLTTDATGSQSICNYISKKTGIDLDVFKKEYYKYNNDLLYGKTKHTDIWDSLRQGLNADISIDVLYESFINTPIDSQMISLATKLKDKNYKIGMITDNKKDRIDSIVEHYGWDKEFDIITVSADVGSGKDSDEIFIKTIQSLYVNADECVFIDNKEKNLIVPKSMGMSVIYFDHQKRDFEKLIQELNNLGISI